MHVLHGVAKNKNLFNVLLSRMCEFFQGCLLLHDILELGANFRPPDQWKLIKAASGAETTTSHFLWASLKKYNEVLFQLINSRISLGKLDLFGWRRWHVQILVRFLETKYFSQMSHSLACFVQFSLHFYCEWSLFSNLACKGTKAWITKCTLCRFAKIHWCWKCLFKFFIFWPREERS